MTALPAAPMRPNRPAHAIGLVLGILLAPPALADIALRCDGCSDLTSRAAALARGHVGTFHVLSVPDGEVRTFNVETSAGGREASPVEVPADLRLAAQGLKEIHGTSRGSMATHFEVDAAALDVPGLATADAQVFLNNGNLRAMIGDRLALADYPARDMTDAVRALLRASRGIIGLGSGVEADVRLRFVDGSRVDYRLRPGRTVTDYIADSARTAQGQALPEANAAACAGTWRGTRDELALVTRQLRALGIGNDIDPGAGATKDAVLVIECRWIAPSLGCRTTAR